MFIYDDLKENKVIDFAINQLIDYDLQEFNSINDWRVFIIEKSESYKSFLEEPKNRHFMKYLHIKVKKPSESPKLFFFKFIRRNPNIILRNDLRYFIAYLIMEFKVSTSEHLLTDETTETLRILVEIFYRVKNCDTLKGYYKYFKKFKEQKLIQTGLSFRSFRKNLRWLDRFVFIAPTYYVDWKTLNQAVFICHLKFNPLLKKDQIDKIVKQIPFLVMPKLSITNFAIDLSTYFVLPRNYIKDLTHLLESMERDGYIVQKKLFQAKSYFLRINLNYFKESNQMEEILSPTNKNYQENYEIEFKKEYYSEFKNFKLSLLDYFILESIRFTSFEATTISRFKLLNKIKSDLSFFLSLEYDLVKELENIHKIIIHSPGLINEFINYLEENEKKGFFFIKDELDLLFNLFNIIEESNEIANIRTFTQFVELLEKKKIIHSVNGSGTIYESAFIKECDFISHIYFEDKENYKNQVEKYRIFRKILDLCSSLKIFNINSIKKIFSKPDILYEISKLKKNRLNELKDTIKYNNISNNYIHQRIDYLLNSSPNIIKPYLLDSIWMNWSYFPEIILKNTPDIKNKLMNIIRYFPKVYFYETNDLYNNDYIIAQLNLFHLTNQEKLILTSLFSKLFKDSIVSFKRFAWDGVLYNFSTRDFYNFNEKKFFYTNDLFDQYLLYVKNVLGKELPKPNKSIETNIMFWPQDKTIKDLMENVSKRLRSDKKIFHKEDIEKLIELSLNLENLLSNKDTYEELRQENFFKQYIKSIKLFPAFHKLGFSQYFLYITPLDFDNLNFKLLLTNTFQKLKHDSYFDSSKSILISYIFPFEDPNTSYLNWLRGQNKIQEYCLFTIESLSQIFHFDRNIGLNDWELDVNNFKKYVQEILADPNRYNRELKTKEFNFGSLNNANFHSHDSNYFKSLQDFYNWHSIDIKKKLQFLSQSVFDELSLLIKNNIVFPYLNLKNLGFKEIVHFFLINIEEDKIDILKNVFQFFNLVSLYEIKGEYYIHGFNNKKDIKKGLMVKLYLPDCRLADFLRIFEYVFQFLKIEKYLILTDLVNGEHFIKSLFGDDKIFENYNPLNNLIWDPKKKIWKNHKLFGPRFEYLYPDLFYHQKKEN
ncbi:MAG: hypothetical protein EU542_01980 [Promethearchaeota archaeon]|nr:MAG: hypothetical protein EU542_01980 [Candidatus Lokiarchaeota archaeon]